MGGTPPVESPAVSPLVLNPEGSLEVTVTTAVSGPVGSLSSESGPFDATHAALAPVAAAVMAPAEAQQHLLPGRWHVPLGSLGRLPVLSVCLSHKCPRGSHCGLLQRQGTSDSSMCCNQSQTNPSMASRLWRSFLPGWLRVRSRAYRFCMACWLSLITWPHPWSSW